MMARRLKVVAEHVNGRLYGDDAPFGRVSTDSRSVAPGELFVALTGERFDGHRFLADAGARGAAGAMVSQRDPTPLPQIQVDDTRLGLGRLGRAWRAGFQLPVIGVTGSNGKTTCKEMMAAILRVSHRVLATRGNLNNEIGVPLTLLELAPEHDRAVVEMGANHAGEIAYLASLAMPRVGVVTNAGAAHLEGFGSLEGVVTAKGEMFGALADDATAVINFDDPAASRWRGMAGGARVLGFGLHSDAFSSVVGAVTPTDVGSRFTLRLDDTEQLIELPLPGHHNVMNALAAAAATWAVGTSIADIAAGLRACQGVGGRLQSVAGRHGARLIDDSYNANPNSVRAAVDILARMPGTRWLVLGDMAELGADGAQLHASIGRYAAEQGVDGLLTVGELAACAADAFGASAISVASVAAAAVALEAQLAPDVTLLIKGSRSMGLERLVAALAREEALC